jgi:hypothetical protein
MRRLPDAVMVTVFAALTVLTLGDFPLPAKIAGGGTIEALSVLAAALVSLSVAAALRDVPEARGPWLLFAVGLLCFAAGEAGDIGYELPGVVRPVPAPPDLAYLLGYAALFAALCRFVASYWRHFPVSSRRELGIIIAASFAALALLGATVVRPLLERPMAPMARAYLVGFAALDVALLSPMVLLVRAAFAFRGGPVARAWVVLLCGFAMMQVADLLFSLSPLLAGTPYYWLDQVGYVASYLLLLKGTLLHRALVG